MKKIISILLLPLISFLFMGCEKLNEKEIVKIESPSNVMLSIKGKWEVLNYKLLSDNLKSNDKLSLLVGNTIEISNNNIKMPEEDYNDSSYKLKIVKDDYVISYEYNYKVKDLNLNKNSVEVFSVINKNNIIMEFFKGDNDKSFIFYKGGLFEVRFVENIMEDHNNDYTNDELENKSQSYVSNTDYNDPVGLYLGIKSKNQDDTEDSLSKESYRTVFISFRDGVLKSIEKKDKIVMPRMSGIWTINKSISKVNGYEREYFDSISIDSKTINSKAIDKNKDITSINTNTYRSIKYVGNDYIATEVYSGKNFKGEYNKYEVLPIDNINSELPANIGDMFSIDGKNVFKNEYEKTISGIKKDELKNYTKNIDYSNFSIERFNGKWNIIAKISPDYNIEGKGYDYLLNLRAHNKLINYDLLSIPWKTLKRKIPLLEDAFISPNNRIAIIVTSGKLLIYEIQNGEIKDSPLNTIPINGSDKIIMAEWCTGDYYVDRWEKPFLD